MGVAEDVVDVVDDTARKLVAVREHRDRLNRDIAQLQKRQTGLPALLTASQALVRTWASPLSSEQLAFAEALRAVV